MTGPAASRLAESGCHVFPVKPRAKVPITARGCLDATRDAGQIADWWSRWPTANIGIACGPSGLAVIDLDGPEGLGGWRQLVAEHPGTPPTLTARTGGGGWHLYYLALRDRRVGNTAGKIGPKIDSRGAGGYVLAPPSVHPSGQSYRWAERQPAELAVLPGWLLALLDPPVRPRSPLSVRRCPGLDRYAAAALAGELERLSTCRAGTRNVSLNAAAFSLGTLVAAGRLDRREVVSGLLAAASAIGLGDREAEKTTTSGLAAGAAHPRDVE